VIFSFDVASQVESSMTRCLNLLLAVSVLFGSCVSVKGADKLAKPVSAKESTTGDGSGLVVLVMDPLSKALACDCVQGYAQRDYEQLGKYLSARLNQPVKVVFGDSITKAFKGNTNAKIDLIIGKDSVVRFDLKKSKQKADLLLQLSDLKGKTTVTGLFVVPRADPALSVIDLVDYRVFFGPDDSAEKHQAPMKLLTDLGVAMPKNIETCSSCSDGASRILELGDDVRAAAVISSYAQPLLEGCGTIQKGDLKVIGESAPVPFISAFINKNVSKPLRKSIEVALLDVGKDAKLKKALETKNGFVKPKAAKKPGRKKQAGKKQAAKTQAVAKPTAKKK
jgi:ABC-type phosphate/phosphonate transport system substrate-binding protein